ncbi:MAG: T9SS type A sorting domain-containing protein [Saprospiraceae bacterium]|nr:T9SS type A sorting domain-containing protein [Saprospiraceae bacterium]
MITGAFLPDSSPWNALLVRMDTLGQLIDFHYYQDTSGDYFSQSLNVDVIKTTDGGYMMTGSLIYTNNGVIIKTSSDGNLEFYKKYPDDKIFSPRKIMERHDGYLVLGYRQRANFRTDVYLMKIDKQGEIVWEKFYGDWELDEVGYCLVMIDPNHFVIGGSKGIGNAPNLYNTYTRSSFWGIDSLGNQQWQWHSNPQNIESAALGLQHLPDGGWLYCTRNTVIMGPLDWGGLCKIVRRDSNMNLVWQRTLLPQPILTWEANNLWDIKPTPDGNWVAVGHWIPYYTEHPDTVSWQGGFVHKFSPDGDSIWTALDTAFYHPVYGLENRLGGAAVLPSGSVIAVGYANSFDGANFKSWAWVLKSDKDGCVDTLCTVVSSGHEPLPEPVALRVYPNPAGDWVRFQWSAPISDGVLTIADATGRVVLRAPLQARQTAFVWDVANIAPGVYFYQIRSEKGAAQTGKFVIRH